MKKLELEVQKSSPEFLKANTIQGLYPEKNCSERFRSLKAKVELAVFSEANGVDA